MDKEVTRDTRRPKTRKRKPRVPGRGRRARTPARPGLRPRKKTGKTKHKKAKQKKKKKRETTFARRRGERLQKLAENFPLVCLICHLHVIGKSVTEILAEVRRKFRDVEIKREDPRWVVGRAAKRGWLVFRPPLHDKYRERVRDLWPHVVDVDVVRSPEVEVVGRQGARMLVRMLRNLAATHEVVHVGIAGGHTMRALMRCLAEEMIEPVSDLPKAVHFHALTSGFNANEPSTDPNTFVTFFDNKPVSTKILFTGLCAPAMVTSDMSEKLRESDSDIADALDFVPRIDIFVTSGSRWHEHCVLRSRMDEADRVLLEEAGVEGDVLWRPISRHGPITAETERRAFTLIELAQLGEFVRAGKQVLLVLAPCAECGKLKGGLARCMLDQRLATHVVADTRSVGQMLGTVSADESER